MLNKSEKRVMRVLYEQCQGKPATLISPMDISKLVGDKDIPQSKIDTIVSDLHMDGYFDIVYSDRHGERVYCITLTEKGKAFSRTSKTMKRNLIFRICLSFALAVFSFLIGLLLKAIF